MGREPPSTFGPLSNTQAALDAAGLHAKVVYSGGADVDVLPARAGKGCALAFLLRRLRAAGLAPPAGVQVRHKRSICVAREKESCQVKVKGGKTGRAGELQWGKLRFGPH